MLNAFDVTVAKGWIVRYKFPHSNAVSRIPKEIKDKCCEIVVGLIDHTNNQNREHNCGCRANKQNGPYNSAKFRCRTR